MKTIRSITEMHAYSILQKQQDKSISFVPTMGYLHEGHISLIKLAKNKADIVVLSIFVNQMQFEPSEDFFQYPRDFDHDKQICKQNNVDIIFYPDSDEMYPKNFQSTVHLKNISKDLCGKSRPTHFVGVVTVISKFFNIVQPNSAIFGQKDFQQVSIIKQMVKDLNFPVKIEVAKIIREKNGLAMSSRNKYLTEKQQKSAIVLYQSLREAKIIFNSGERKSNILIKKVKKLLTTIECKIDYIEIVSNDQLVKIKHINQKAVLAIAVYFGQTRLIDNVILE